MLEGISENEEIQKEEYSSSSDSFGIDLPVEEINSEIIQISTTDDILITIHQEINKQTELLESIHQQQTDFMMFLYFGFVVLVIIGVSKFLDKVLFRFI